MNIATPVAPEQRPHLHQDTPAAAIEVEHLIKRYPDVTAVDVA